MSGWAHDHPEEMLEISRLPLSQQPEALRGAMGPSIEAAERRREQIKDTFGPWYSDPVRIARLYRWLDLMDRLPRDVALFIESAASYESEYAAMRAAEQGVGK